MVPISEVAIRRVAWPTSGRLPRLPIRLPSFTIQLRARRGQEPWRDVVVRQGPPRRGHTPEDFVRRLIELGALPGGKRDWEPRRSPVVPGLAGWVQEEPG